MKSSTKRQRIVRCPAFGRIHGSAGVPPAFPRDDLPLRDGGTGATAYAEAIGVYSGLALSRFADRNNALCAWYTGPTGTRASTGGSARTASLRNLFSRQAIPMAWDYGEANPFSDSGGGYSSVLSWIVRWTRHSRGSGDPPGPSPLQRRGGMACSVPLRLTAAAPRAEATPRPRARVARSGTRSGASGQAARAGARCPRGC